MRHFRGSRRLVIEGCDGTGKSTLARKIAGVFDLHVKSGEGPPKTQLHYAERLVRYLRLFGNPSIIYDRHPIVSQYIYAQLRPTGITIPWAYQDQFYGSNPIFIYCADSDGKSVRRHTRAIHDTDQHLDAVNSHYPDLIKCYDEWALKKAHLIYRIGEDIEPILSYLQPHLGEEL
jgi:hypothetical protein